SILLRLGFRKSSAVFKTRNEYSFAGTTVALDEVAGLGSFVEIEVISEDKDSALRTIADVKKRLEIAGEHIQVSYLEMILKKEGLLS
ncbi:MAG: CYTH domain-containing protein, partial [Methanomicrobium sp.]|nr:CYTH domain-containing protein [Methanomicrobium sp.]